MSLSHASFVPQQQFYHPEVLSVIGKLVSGTDEHRPDSKNGNSDPDVQALLSSMEISNLYQVKLSKSALDACGLIILLSFPSQR